MFPTQSREISYKSTFSIVREMSYKFSSYLVILWLDNSYTPIYFQQFIIYKCYSWERGQNKKQVEILKEKKEWFSPTTIKAKNKRNPKEKWLVYPHHIAKDRK